MFRSQRPRGSGRLVPVRSFMMFCGIFSLLLLLTLPIIVQAVPYMVTHDEAESVQTVRFNTPERRRVTQVENLGVASIPASTIFNNFEIGGLSGITYDPNNSSYYAVSDNRDEARFYTLQIDLSNELLNDGDVTFTHVTTLTNVSGVQLPSGTTDTEGIALTSKGTLYISSEGEVGPSMLINAPFVNEFLFTGQQSTTLAIPTKFTPTFSGTQVSGIRNNRAFESLTISPDERYLYAAVENALVQDGPAATATNGTNARIIKYDLATGNPVAEMVYPAGPILGNPSPSDLDATNGLVELLAVDNNGTLLALERSFSSNFGFTVKLYEGLTQGALTVEGVNDLFNEGGGVPFEIDPHVLKRELLDFTTLGFERRLDNFEGMTFGPTLNDGRQTLILVSDNNFQAGIPTRFIALALTIESWPAALPDRETPDYANQADAATQGRKPGDSDDPAIWVHPTNQAQSLVIGTVKDGGLVVFDLAGQIVQEIAPTTFGAERYNNVDIIYNFTLGSSTVDLAVVSDRANDTLAIFTIDSTTRQLTNVTSTNIPGTIFGVDDGQATAYGLAGYVSLQSGTAYVFVTQANGNQVAQLALSDDGSGGVNATVVRVITLEGGGSVPSDLQAEGIVVDQQLGRLFVVPEKFVGILAYEAEPGGSTTPTLVQPITASYLTTDIEGLEIYYGPNGSGYLLVSSQGDSSFAVLDRQPPYTYRGSFVIGDNGAIDQANESDGLAVNNVALGSNYALGLLVVQDGANDPQLVVENNNELENNATNFKFVPWQVVANAFAPPLIVDTMGYNPRAVSQIEPTATSTQTATPTSDPSVPTATPSPSPTPTVGPGPGDGAELYLPVIINTN